jgi:hypothetical protein
MEGISEVIKNLINSQEQTAANNYVEDKKKWELE